MKKLVFCILIILILISSIVCAGVLEFITGMPVRENVDAKPDFAEKFKSKCGDGKCSLREKIFKNCPEDCSPKLKKVPCETNTDCPKTHPYCLNQNYCVECLKKGQLDPSCPLSEALCLDYKCTSKCIDHDGNNIYEMNHGYYIWGNKYITTLDKCTNGPPEPYYLESQGLLGPDIFELSCDIDPPNTQMISCQSPFDDSHYCFLGACRQPCETSEGCSEGQECIAGYCVKEFYDFFEWMREKGYGENFIDMYKEGAQDIEWAKTWYVDYLSKKDAYDLNNLVYSFKYDDHIYTTIYLIQDTDSVCLREEQLSDSEIAKFQEKLNNIFGRDPENPFFIVNTEVIYVDYDEIYSCEECGNEILEEPGDFGFCEFDGVKEYFTLEGAETYAMGDWAFEWDDYHHFSCKTDGADIFLFNTYTIEEEGRIFRVTHPFQPSAKEECNVLYNMNVFGNNFEGHSLSLIHELGHTFGLAHPYYPPTQDIMLPETLMIQNPDRGSLGIVSRLSPIEMYYLEPEGGYEKMDELVEYYNTNAAFQEYTEINMGDQ